MRKSKLDAPETKKRVVQELALGKSQSSIAREVGLHSTRVCRFANREDIVKLIEAESFRLYEAVPDAVQNVKDLIAEMKYIPKTETKRRELAYKASTDVLKSAGILPTAVQSQTFIDIKAQTNNQLIPPIVQKLLDIHLRDLKIEPGESEGEEDWEAKNG